MAVLDYNQHLNSDSDDYDQHLNSDSDVSNDQTNSDGMLCDDYNIGDLVWAKVKSHPWWPGQVFDPALASEEAKSMAKPDRILVAFFGDHTFSWLEHSQVRAFKDHFRLKVKATNAKVFKRAVLEALCEVCWRAEMKLQCRCRIGSKSNINSSIAKHWVHAAPVKLENVTTTKDVFNARSCLSFIKHVACSPGSSFSSNYKATVLHGHALGLRTSFFANVGDDALLGSSREPLTLKASVNRDASERDANKDITMKEQSSSEFRKRVNGESALPLADWRAKRQHVVERHREELSAKELKNPLNCCGIDIEVVLTSEDEPVRGADPALLCEDQTYKESGCVNQLTKREIDVLPELSPESTSLDRTKLELKQQNVKVTPCNLASFCDEKASHIFRQLSEALRFLAIDPLCSHGLSSNSARIVAAILSHRNFVFQKSSGYNTHLRSSGTQDGARIVAQDGKAKLGNKTIRFCRPTNKRLDMSVDVNNGNNAETINGQTRRGNKISPIPGLNSMKGSSQAHAKALIDIDSLKLDVHELLLQAQKKKTGVIKRVPIDALRRESDQNRGDVSANGSFRDGENIYSGGFGNKSRPPCVPRTNEISAPEHLLEVSSVTEVGPDDGFAGEKKVSFDGFGDMLGSRCVPETNVHSEHRVEVSSFTGVFVEQGSIMEPLEDTGEAEQGSTMEPLDDTGVCHASDTAVCSAGGPQPTMRFSEDTGVDSTSDTGVCSAEQGSIVEPFSSQNVGIISHQQSENGTKPHLPVGVYMKFPSSFVLPSELQLNAIFTQFGDLGTARVRVFRETASAQVIFQHSKEAERAYKCVKEASPFGEASVIFRLQYFARV